MFERRCYPQSLFTEVGNEWVAEASDLQLPHGRWPDVIHIRVGSEERKFHPWRQLRDLDGDTVAMVYRSENALFNGASVAQPGHVLKIFND